MTERSWFTAKAGKDNSAEVAIFGEIGMWGITAKDFHTELKALGAPKEITVRINSPGGNVFDGLTIYNILKRHKASITVIIDGIAASIASVIAMAGDEIIMPENAMMMIHDPSGVVVGTSKEMRELADVMDKIKGSLIAAYVAKSGMERDEIATLMEEETWFTAEEAAEKGLADTIEKAAKIAASFDLTKFRNAPADAGRKARGQSDARQSASKEENSMTDAEKTAAEAEAKTKLEAEAKAKVEAEAKAKTEAEAKAKADAEAKAKVEGDVAAERTRAKDIAAACAIAKSDKASVFIAEGKTVGEVLAALKAAPAGKPGEELNTHSRTTAETVASWDKALARVNGK